MSELKKERNLTVDILRGIAIILVVIGHCISGRTVGFESSPIFRLVWSLQMPLFMIISGYLANMSREIGSLPTLGRFVGRRSLGYLVPWLVGMIIIRFMIIGEMTFPSFADLFYKMDQGYWFFISLWTISVIFGLSDYLSHKICRGKNNPLLKSVSLIALYLVGAGVLLGVGLIFGLSFFAIKLTLYYMPFYLAGWLYGRLQNLLSEKKYWNACIAAAVAVSAAVYSVLLFNLDIYALEDSFPDIIIRALVSVMGCVALCGLVSGVVKGGRISKAIAYVGVHSLEIYLLHYLFISIFSLGEVAFYSVEGILVSFANVIVALALSLLIAKLFSTNRYLKLFLFGKLK